MYWKLWYDMLQDFEFEYQKKLWKNSNEKFYKRNLILETRIYKKNLKSENVKKKRLNKTKFEKYENHCATLPKSGIIWIIMDKLSWNELEYDLVGWKSLLRRN